jgi:ferrochelatase
MEETKNGVLLVNLGTPESPHPDSIRRYLREFLSDQRVVDIPGLLWKPILNLFILPTRAKKVSELYSDIWTDQGSPLAVNSKRQRDALRKRLNNIPVEFGMSYGNPSLKNALDHLMSQGVTRLNVLPLYPQFSSTTVGAVWDALARTLSSYKTLPSLLFIRDYADHPAYINALKSSVERSFSRNGKPDLLLVSFHGIPQRFANEGDDYPDRCFRTGEALKEALGLDRSNLMISFQSRFGFEPWLQPYTDEVIKFLPDKGIKNIQIISPGFSSDCLETLSEINDEYRDLFLKSGGTKFEYIAALNNDELHIDMMVELIQDKFY